MKAALTPEDLDLNDLRALVRVVAAGSMAAVARAEGVPVSTVSRRVARLEEALGVQLLVRAGRGLTLTEDGRALHARAEGAVRELEQAGEALRAAAGEARGRLVISAPHDLTASPALARLLLAYRARCPAVQVEVRLESHLVDLAQEGVDVAFRGHVAGVPGQGELMSRALASFEVGAFASAEHLSRYGIPHEPEALLAHPLALHVAQRGRPLVLRRGDEERTLDLPEPVVQVNHFLLLRDLLLGGVGVGLLPLPEGEQSGLHPVLPGWRAVAGRLSLVWLASRHLSPRVRLFVDLASQEGAYTAWRRPER